MPTNAHFPNEVQSEKQVVRETFKTVQKYCGLESWPCRLEAQEADANPKIAPTVNIQNSPINPLGTFTIDEQTRSGNYL